ncbi:MAG: hypothetical protein V2I46_12165 [Bacteroides sp.]|jgi:hypothetical protein|nr:hypothetical protein [Robiginitalea marina]MEE4178250.1 hypothetical protein [Bacteroides sp.]
MMYHEYVYVVLIHYSINYAIISFNQFPNIGVSNFLDYLSK